jgi:hypothetical protein
MDEPQGSAHSLEMNAMLTSVSIRINPNSGDVKYKLVFIYPPGYDEYLKQLVVGAADMYWNDTLVGQSTKIASLSVKPQKDADPLYVVHFDLDGGDVMRANMGAAAHNPSGTLRLVSTQLALFSR